MSEPVICRTTEDLRASLSEHRKAGRRIVMVPTMGALHAGHRRLMRHALDLGDTVVASIFVNPTQFAPNEDFDRYPRQEAVDVGALAAEGVETVFIPDVTDMYDAHDATRIVMSGPAEGLESDFRPHFFGGVATVVSRLLLAALPDAALFGEKDYQQLLVIRRMTLDLKIPTAIHGAPTVREDDGLALSSRNAYLSEEERRTAPELHRALETAARAIRDGAMPAAACGAAVATLEEAGFRPDYVAARNAETLAPLEDAASEPVRLLAAAWLGKTRLIDNIPG